MAEDTLKILPLSRVAPNLDPMSYEEFLDWEGGTQHVEWVDGNIVLMSPVSREHQAIGLFLIKILTAFVEARELGTLQYEPFQMKTGPDLPGRAPDILFVSKKNLGRLKRLYLEGPADLVVEIISQGTRAVDRGKKFDEYQQGGVEEYWLIEPALRQAEFYQRGEDGIYRLGEIASNGIYRSKVLAGLWLKVDWLWQEPLPPLLTILREWKLISSDSPPCL